MPIDKTLYLHRLNKLPKEIYSFIVEDENTNFKMFVDKEFPTLTNKNELVESLKSNTNLLLLDFLDFNSFFENFVELFDLDEKTVESKIENFISSYLDLKIVDFIEKKRFNDNRTEPKEDKLEEAKLTEKTEPTHISHQDLLSEIENPTPSISTTTEFQNRVVETAVNTPTITVTARPSVTNSTALTNSSTNQTQSPSLHSSDPSVTPYTNPALNVATKLDQNLASPSASIPKDVYVSKKPDPYHEPVDF